VAITAAVASSHHSALVVTHRAGSTSELFPISDGFVKAASKFTSTVKQEVGSFFWTKKEEASVSWFVSTQDLGKRLAEQEPIAWCSDMSCVNSTQEKESCEIIDVDDEVRYQEILGIGTSLEAATAYNMAMLNKSMLQSVIDSLVDPDDGLGFNLLRVAIGTSDFTPLPFYSYADGEDSSLDKFSIHRDEEFVLPMILAALNRGRKWAGEVFLGANAAESVDGPLIFASPWSPPAWMKSSGKLTGGALMPEFHQLYAEYLVKFIKAYEQKGVPIYALTVENEPLAFAVNYPTMRLEA